MHEIYTQTTHEYQTHTPLNRVRVRVCVCGELCVCVYVCLVVVVVVCSCMMIKKHPPGVQGWLSGSSVMMLSKCYGMFWVQTQPCTPKRLEKRIVIASDCGSIVGPSWVGPIMGPSWLHRGPIVGPSWVHRGSIVGPSWTHRGPIVGPSWTHRGPIVGPSWACSVHRALYKTHNESSNH